MGNSAMKCCPCRGRTVSVVLLSGEIAEFKEPVRASTVMRRYPQHVVLHCSMASNRGMGQRRKIIVLKPEQALKRNQNYLVTPVQTARNAKPFLDSWAFFTLSATKKFNGKMRQKAHISGSNRRSWIQTLFDKIFRVPRSFQSLDDDDDTRPLLNFNQPAIEPRKSSESLREWRPSLECIPESPTLTHISSIDSDPYLDFRLS